MIEVEKIIKRILQSLIDSGQIGFYHYGNEYELKRVFDLQNYQNKYPFVWLNLPLDGQSTEHTFKKEVECRIKLILSTSSHEEWLNDKRNIETYDKVLVPLSNALQQAFNKSPNSLVVNNEYNIKKYPNYHTKELGTREKPQKRMVNAYWDVIIMEFNGIFKDFCN